MGHGFEVAASQQYVERPCAPSRYPVRRLADKFSHGGCWYGFEDALQDEQVNALVPQRKTQVITEGIPGPISAIKNSPESLLPMAAADMLVRDTRRTAHGRFDGKRTYKRSKSGKF